MVRSMIMDSYAWFKGLVQERRPLTAEQVATLDLICGGRCRIVDLEGKPIRAKTVTLEVKPSQAEIIAVAVRMGSRREAQQAVAPVPARAAVPVRISPMWWKAFWAKVRSSRWISRRRAPRARFACTTSIWRISSL